jgi:hypothetical protein
MEQIKQTIVASWGSVGGGTGSSSRYIKKLAAYPSTTTATAIVAVGSIDFIGTTSVPVSGEINILFMFS